MSRTSDGQELRCPNCDVLGRVRLIPQRDRCSGARSCKGTCGACGYFIAQLGSDGTQTKAADEWHSIYEHAMQVKAQLLGATKMKEKQLELDINQAEDPTLTGWIGIETEEEVPVRSGWYNVRFKMSDGERAERKPPPERRYWSERLQCFSWAVATDGSMDDREMHDRKLQHFAGRLDDLEWQGRISCHPDLVLRVGQR